MAKDIDTTSPHYKGKFDDIYAVERKYPHGGVEGDYVDIQGWAHYWNADRATWCVNDLRDAYWDELLTSISSNGSSGGGSGDSGDCSGKLDKSSVVQTTGSATDKVMSQKAVTEQLKALVTLITGKEFALSMYSTNGWNFSHSMVTKTDDDGNYVAFTTLNVKGFYYNQEVTDNMYNVKWTRETSYPRDDEVWNLKHASDTNAIAIPITYEDLGGENYQIGDVVFKCEAQYTTSDANYQTLSTINL